MADPCHDPASDVVTAFITGMRDGFNPQGPCPPDGGGSTTVRFFAADDNGLPLSLIPAGGDCDDPFLWVRVTHRFRSRRGDFPGEYAGALACTSADVVRAVGIEVGVGRCTTMEREPDWDVLATEAEVSLDDSWRLELVLCTVAARLRSKTRAVAVDSVVPMGPDGGITAWLGRAAVQL